MIFKLIGESSLFIIKFSRCVTIKKQTLNYILFLCKSKFNIKLVLVFITIEQPKLIRNIRV